MKHILYFVGAGLSKALSTPGRPIPAMFDFISVMADYIVEEGPHSEVILANLINLEKSEPYPYAWESAEAKKLADRLQKARTATYPRPPYPEDLRRAFRDALRRRPAESVEDILERANAAPRNDNACQTEVRFQYAISSLFATIHWDLNWTPLQLFLQRQLALDDTFHTFVSFNYDLILDRSLQVVCQGEHFGEFDASSCYGFRCVKDGDLNDQQLGSQTRQSKFVILKPHGSLNWLVPTAEADMTMSYDADRSSVVLPSQDGGLAYPTPGENFNICLGYDREPYILPPTAAKRPDREFVREVRKQEEDAIRKADQVYILGWSMAKTDSDQECLVRHNVSQRRNQIEQLVVVNYAAGPDYFRRVADVFNKRPEQLLIYNAGFADFAYRL